MRFPFPRAPAPRTPGDPQEQAVGGKASCPHGLGRLRRRHGVEQFAGDDGGVSAFLPEFAVPDHAQVSLVLEHMANGRVRPSQAAGKDLHPTPSRRSSNASRTFAALGRSILSGSPLRAL